MTNPISSKIKIKTGDNTYQEIHPINTVDEVYIDVENNVKLSSLFNSDGSVYNGTVEGTTYPRTQIIDYEVTQNIRDSALLGYYTLGITPLGTEV